MEKKLDRGRIIRECIGEGLSDLGFAYERYEGGAWVFARKLGKLTWYVYIDVYRFDPWQATFFLRTDVPGKMQVLAQQMEGLDTNGEMPGYWKYHDEDSMREALGEMLGAIRGRGVEILKKLSVPERVSTDNGMYHELYLHHREHAEGFEKRTGITATGYDADNLRRWFDYIDGRIGELSRGQYDDAAKRELIEMAAFLGESIVKYEGGEWNHFVSPDKKEVFGMNYKDPSNRKITIYINILSLLVGRYLGNSREWLERPFYRVIDAAGPLEQCIAVKE